jgi:hypothetical protein
MFRLQFVHIVIVLFVYVTNRLSTNKGTATHNKDLIRESFKRHLNDYFQNKWLLLVLTLLPIYWLLGKPSVAEHVCVLYVYQLLLRTVHKTINPSNQPPDFHTPFFMLSLLVALQNNLLNRSYLLHSYLSVLMYSFVNLYNKPHTTTTTSISNEIMLSHLLFFVFKSH